MKNSLKTILLGLVLALVLFAGLLAIQRHILSKYDRAEAVIVKKTVPAGYDITEKNAGEYFETASIMKSLIVDSTITRLEDMYGSYAGVKLEKGELVYQEELRKESKETKNIKEPVEVSVGLSSFSDGVSGTLRKGDYVYVYFVSREDGSVTQFGDGPVYIKQSFNSSGEPVAVSDKTTAASVFTLIIEKESNAAFCEGVKQQDIVLSRTDDIQNIRTDLERR